MALVEEGVAQLDAVLAGYREREWRVGGAPSPKPDEMRAPAKAVEPPPDDDRVAALEAEVADLRAVVGRLMERIDAMELRHRMRFGDPSAPRTLEEIADRAASAASSTRASRAVAHATADKYVTRDGRKRLVR